MNNTSVSHWQKVASGWKHFGPPLRPSGEDVRHFERIVANEHARGNGMIEALMCGVTPEIATMCWPATANVTAIEQSPEMIREVWPGDRSPGRRALQGNWLDVSNTPGHFDIAIGDGCFISMGYPAGYDAFAEKIKIALKGDGLLLMRFFAKEGNDETAEQVLADLLSGRIGSFHAFKWRLAMSLQSSSEEGVRLQDIYAAWAQAGISPSWLSGKTGWPLSAIDTIALYEGRENRFHFASIPEIEHSLGKHFHRESIDFPEYELGERCPIMAFRPR